MQVPPPARKEVAGVEYQPYDYHNLLEVLRNLVRNSPIYTAPVPQPGKEGWSGLIGQLAKLAEVGVRTDAGAALVDHILYEVKDIPLSKAIAQMAERRDQFQKMFEKNLHMTIAPFHEAKQQKREGPELDGHWQQWKDVAAPSLLHQMVEIAAHGTAAGRLREKHGIPEKK